MQGLTRRRESSAHSLLVSKTMRKTQSCLGTLNQNYRKIDTFNFVLYKKYCSPASTQDERTLNERELDQPQRRLGGPRAETIVRLRRELLDRIAADLNVKELEDWYKVRKQDMYKRGRHLFRHYHSVFEVVRNVYAGFDWDPTRFVDYNATPTEQEWRDPKIQRKRLDQIAHALQITKMEGWYGVTRKEVESRGCKGLFKVYASLPEALKGAYPEYPWDSRQFSIHPAGFWNEKENLLFALDKVEKGLNISKPEDWYTVNLTDMREGGFPSKVNRLQLISLLQEKYPEYTWKKDWLLRGRLAQQKRLENTIEELFKGKEIQTNTRVTGVINPETGVNMELDIYIPSLQLAFEYQERHHFISTRYSYQPQQYYVDRDNTKKREAAKKGIAVVSVPCWWDGSAQSLIATILKTRPDLETLFSENKGGKAIPDEPPENFFENRKMKHVEDIGEPTTACFFTLSNVDPSGWWMFEKYDGLRGFWNPNKKLFYSRFNTIFDLPEQVTSTMPKDLFLDGELWFGRDRFEEATKISKRVDAADVDWAEFRYMVFDIPNHTGTYEERFKILEQNFGGEGHPYIRIARKENCKNLNHLESFFQDVIDKGGEGVILRNPSAIPKSGRCPAYLKHKKYRDAEAKIVSKIDDETWECELPNGVRFSAPAGTSEFRRRCDPKAGDVVSFKHHGFLLASKKPKWPTLYRLRTDLTWEQVIHNWKEKKITPTGRPFRRPKNNHKPLGYWGKPANRKKFFEELAAKLNFDPTVARNWTKITTKDISENRGLGLIAHYHGSWRKAITDTYPELKLTFEGKPKGYWNSLENRVNFFAEVAADLGFDPTDHNKWTQVSTARILARNGAGLLNKYGGLRRALADTYPALANKV